MLITDESERKTSVNECVYISHYRKRDEEHNSSLKL